jgi:precorrin-6B methylase 2
MNQATRDFIREHAEENVRQLALRGSKNPEVDLTYALEQIAGRQMARTKIPSWAVVEGIVYPPHLSMEQCSSEQTARYKESLAGKGMLVVDLTGGFGVDLAFISKDFKQAVYVERQPALCAISSENFKRLGLEHIEVVCGDGIEYLHQLDHADLIFLDPARRDAHGGRTYGIADCTPNVLEILDEMVEKADRVLLKLSPMLDWRKAVDDISEKREVKSEKCFAQVNAVHIVSVDNECKELLIEVKNGKGEKVKKMKVVCVNLLHDHTREVFEYEIPSPSPSFTLSPFHPFTFLFEPNASIMKAGCFELLEQRFGVRQLDRNSHLFVADKEIPEFPGRQFVIERTTSMNKRELKDALAGIDRANITVRNFPMSVVELRKKLRLKDGGDVFIFATTVAGEGHQLFICHKIPQL